MKTFDRPTERTKEGRKLVVVRPYREILIIIIRKDDGLELLCDLGWLGRNGINVLWMPSEAT